MNKCVCRDAGSILKSLTAREVWLHNDEDFGRGQLSLIERSSWSPTGRFLPRIVVSRIKKSLAVSVIRREQNRSITRLVDIYIYVLSCFTFLEIDPEKVSRENSSMFLMRASSLCRIYAVKACHYKCETSFTMIRNTMIEYLARFFSSRLN